MAPKIFLVFSTGILFLIKRKLSHKTLFSRAFSRLIFDGIGYRSHRGTYSVVVIYIKFWVAIIESLCNAGWIPLNIAKQQIAFVKLSIALSNSDRYSCYYIKTYSLKIEAEQFWISLYLFLSVFIQIEFTIWIDYHYIPSKSNWSSAQLWKPMNPPVLGFCRVK